jgi:hypothetical protein
MNPAPRWTKDPDLDDKLDALERGKRYMIIWTNDSRRTDRMSVLKFLGHNSHNDDTSWDARPDAGTQNMPRSWILRVEKASPIAKVIIDEKAPVPMAEVTDVKSEFERKVFERKVQHCGNRQQHEEHVTRVGQGWRLVCPGVLEDLTKSADVGVRWQAQMEEHLHEVRTLSAESMRLLNLPGVIQDERVKFNVRQRTELAKANASAALALAISNGVSDLESVLERLAKPLIIAVDADFDVEEMRDLFDQPVPFSPQWHAMQERARERRES